MQYSTTHSETNQISVGWAVVNLISVDSEAEPFFEVKINN